MKSLPFSYAAWELFHNATLALARVEAAGIKIDTDYLTKTLTRTARKIKHKQRALEFSEVMHVWMKRYKGRTNLNSGVQLGKVIFQDMGYEAKQDGKTAGGQWKTDEDALAGIDHPFVKDYLDIKRLQYGERFLKGIQEEVCDGFLHPTYSLNIAKSFRSSGFEPNFQNLPSRDQELKEMVRRCIVSRPGRRIIEIDYKKIEVKTSCCYHKDPNLIKYETDPTTDMHFDSAMEIFLLPKEEMHKEIRHAGKNQFVFPQFYGAFWLDCARHLWEYARKLKTASGVPLHDHLRKKGIKRLGDQNRAKPSPKPGTFEAHVQKVERSFWEDRFPVYSEWKKDHYAAYLKRGYCTSLTGFVFQGLMVKNEVNNYPIQSCAFHCLLWSLERLVNHELRKRKMKTLIVGQIHDSLIADCPEEETDDFISLATQVMTKDLLAAWKWITIPLEVEIDKSPLDGSWVDKGKED